MANPSISVFADAADGQIRNAANTSWAAVRGAAAGTLATTNAAKDNAYFIGYWTGDAWYIERFFLGFDTSSIPDDAVIIAATLYIYPDAITNVGYTDSLCVVEGTQASPTALTTADFDQAGATELATRVSTSGLSTAAYKAIPLNTSGLAVISKTGYTKLALRSARDVDNSAPSNGQYSILLINTADQTGTSKDPYLVVEYSTDRTTSDSWAWTDSALKGDGIEGGHGVSTRSTSDAWAWSETAAKRAAPAARTMVGSPVKVFATNGVPDTFGAHYAFGFTIAYRGTLICFVNKASHHGASDGVIVSKTSTDDGATWGSEVLQPTIIKARTSNSGTRIHAALGYGSQPQYRYSDDGGATWSTAVNIAHGFYSTYVYTDDILELPNGNLIYSAYGYDTSGLVSYSIRTSVSTDGGATWSAQALVTNMNPSGQYGMGESQMESRGGSEIYMTFHDVESPVPTDYYRCRSLDGGATWGTPVMVNDDDSFNRQGCTALQDGGVIVSYNRWNSGAVNVSYVESWDGTEFGSPVQVAGWPVGGSGYGHPLWSMSTALGGEGLSQNIGFTYSTESGAQTSAETYYVQFSGLDGTIVYRRATSDSWAWSDAAAQTHALGKTTSDSWAWSDAALGSHRSTADAWAWSDAATRTTINAKTTADTWAWSDVAAQTVPGSSKTTADTWAWSDTATRTAPKARTTTDTWLWTEPPEVNTPSPLFWLRARRRTMSAPTKTYVAVLPKGTTRTSSYTSPTYEAKTEAGILVVLDVTAASGTGGLTLRINAHDQASAQAVALNAAPTAVTAVGTTSYALYPFGAVAGNVTQATEFYLPRMFSITVTHGDSSSYTYSLGYCLLP